MSLNNLYDFNFHDLPVESLKVDFERCDLDLVVSVYNEEKKEYEIIHFVFNKIFDIVIKNKILLNDNSSTEISKTELSEIPNGFHISFIFNQGFANPSFELSFAFSSLSDVKNYIE